MSKIKKVEGTPKFPELEDKINSFWKTNKIFEKSVEQRPIENSYSFVDGPPFVTGTPHYGSLLPSIAKDAIPRYWTMKGKRVRRVFGWDCHGLPIEEKVNRKFGIKSSKQLEEEMGVDKYVQECRSYVQSCSSDWRWYIEKIGRWVDMDNAYYTMNPEFMESVIWAFKQMYEKGYVYEGKRVSLFSTDTSTPVSEFEVAMDADNYREVEDLSIFVKFHLQQNDKFGEASIVAWTTTPWTIPSNFALAVNPDELYCLVEFEGQKLLLAKSRLEYAFQTTEEHIGTDEGKLVKVLCEFKGTEMVGLKYYPVYDFFVNKTTPKDHAIYAYSGVSMEEGTGVLHIAPAFGAEDYELGKQHGLSDYSDIDEQGKMTVGSWKGTYLRDACDMITANLQEKGNLLRSEMYTHRLPFYRGENPLIYMAQASYFLDIQKIKARMLELNQDINWIPEHIKEGRFAKTVASSPDWAVSRNRYWATILPLWKSEDGEEIVIGSFEEMTQYTDQVTKVEKNGRTECLFEEQPMDLHRDVCDKIVLYKDGKEFHRVPEVLDCWMDSGSVPFAEHHYPFEHKDEFEQAFPADFIIEYVGQVRAWFNVLLRVSTMIFDQRPFTNVICTGVLAGNDGRKMSKSFGNYPDPKLVLETIGGEALRLYMMGSVIMVGGDMNWSDELLNEQVKNILIPLWNTYKYLTIYTDLHNWTPEHANYTSTHVLDTWLHSYMNKVTLEYAKALEAYNYPESVKVIQPAIDTLSTWWIRRSRDRFVAGDAEALQTLYAALVQLTLTFAPQMPFVTEEMYQNLVVGVLPDARESVHLEDYPEVGSSTINVQLLADMNLVRRASSLGQNLRVANGLKLRQPLARAYVNLENPELQAIVRDELNVKEVVAVSEPVQAEGVVFNNEEEVFVGLETKITPALREEGLLAELKRQLQNFRKNSGLKMGQKVAFQISTDSEEIKDVVKRNCDELCQEVSAKTISIVAFNEGKSIKVKEYELVVTFEE